MPPVPIPPAGVEHCDETPGNTAFLKSSGARGGAIVRQVDVLDADLVKVIDAWVQLPEAVRTSILTMVRAADGASTVAASPSAPELRGSEME